MNEIMKRIKEGRMAGKKNVDLARSVSFLPGSMRPATKRYGGASFATVNSTSSTGLAAETFSVIRSFVRRESRVSSKILIFGKNQYFRRKF